MKSTVSIFLSLLLLLSSTGITYAEHYCGDHKMISKITLGQEALSCGMSISHGDACDEGMMEDHNCCDNEYTQVDTDDNFSQTSFDLQIAPHFIASFVTVFVFQEEVAYDTHIPFFKDYSPPPLGEDLQVLYETFLI